MSNRVNISSGSSWEPIIGYSRAVKIGNIIEVSGTTAVDNDKTVGINDPYTQTKFILEKIGKILDANGSSLKDVVRTRIFCTDISKWEAIGKAHGEIFSVIRPVTTMVEVSKLIGDELLVEIEVSAIISK
jgi:enamine deaminase RidA (YjgF/YER057c/UK114 family)